MTLQLDYLAVQNLLTVLLVTHVVETSVARICEMVRAVVRCFKQNK